MPDESGEDRVVRSTCPSSVSVMTTQLHLVIASLLLLVFLGLGVSSLYFHNIAAERQERLTQLQSELDQSQATQAIQVLQFQRANTLSAAASSYNAEIFAKSEVRQRDTRNDLENEECADRDIPDAIAIRVFQHTHSLRTRTLSHSGKLDGAAAGTASSTQTHLWRSRVMD
ncbi:DUF2570 domain-containing protein [Yersinia alsatica]